MAKTYNIIASTVITATSTSISFTSITSGYTDLVLVAHCKVSPLNTSSKITFNNDTTGTNYSRRYIATSGTGSLVSGTYTDTYGLEMGGFYNEFDISHVSILDYANTNKHKTAINNYMQPSSENAAVLIVGTWKSTSAISTITWQTGSPSYFFNPGCSFSLYGVKGAT